MRKVSMIDGPVALAANTTNKNVLSDERYVNAPFPMQSGALFSTGSALGLTAEINVGGVSVMPPAKVNANNRIPIVPDDLTVADFDAEEGDLIQLTVVNPTGGALNFFYKVELELME